jgi:class 3 adenylate cyclase
MTITPLANGVFVGALVAGDAGEGAAQRVARCALDLHARMPAATIAIATGRAIVGGSIPVGDAIDRAARLLSRGRTKDVLVDDATASVVESRFELAREGDATILVRERDAADRGRTVLGRTTPCVGRDREIAILEATYAECVAEPIARAVVVTVTRTPRR